MNDLIQNALVALVTLVLIPLIIPPLLRLLATLPEPWRGIIRGFLDALKTASQTATTQAAKKAVLTAEQMVKPSAAATPTEKAARKAERDVVIIRRGPDGETINVEGGPGEWTSEDGHRRIIIGGPGHEGEDRERHVMVFRHDSEGGLDVDGDGRWSFEEMVAPMREHFNQLDANSDGFVDESERRH